MKRILAIDYGLKRTGIAVTDPTGTIAQPLKTIPTTELWDFLDSYLATHQVGEIVVGYPRNLDGTPTPLTPHVEQLMVELESRYGIPVRHIDERFTSRWAERQLAGTSIRKKKEWTDALAAANILETYLMRRQNQA